MSIDPLRTYDYLARARARIFDLVRPLGDEQYRRQFPIGPGSLARVLTHIMISEWYYIQRMLGADVPPYDQWPIRDENPPPFAELEAQWTRQAAETRTALAAVGDWSARLKYRVTDDDGRQIDVTASPADLLTQLALHEVHHRAQALNILRQLGVTLEEDIDFNAMMYDRRPVAGQA
jgi:uncharacterized damage-inducible protein DinB